MAIDVADSELKARHRAMWAKGDYPRMVDTFLLPIGQRLVDACPIAPGTTRARCRRQAPATPPFPPPRAARA